MNAGNPLKFLLIQNANNISLCTGNTSFFFLHSFQLVNLLPVLFHKMPSPWFRILRDIFLSDILLRDAGNTRSLRIAPLPVAFWLWHCCAEAHVLTSGSAGWAFLLFRTTLCHMKGLWSCVVISNLRQYVGHLWMCLKVNSMCWNAKMSSRRKQVVPCMCGFPEGGCFMTGWVLSKASQREDEFIWQLTVVIGPFAYVKAAQLKPSTPSITSCHHHNLTALIFLVSYVSVPHLGSRFGCDGIRHATECGEDYLLLPWLNAFTLYVTPERVGMGFVLIFQRFCYKHEEVIILQVCSMQAPSGKWCVLDCVGAAV